MEQWWRSDGTGVEQAPQSWNIGGTLVALWWHRPCSRGAAPEMPKLRDTERLRVLCLAGAGLAHQSDAHQADPERGATTGIAAELQKARIQNV